MNGRNEKPLLVVLDQDETYVWKLTEYMNAKSGFPFEAAAFTSLEKLAAYRKEEIRVLLLDESILSGHEGTVESLAPVILLLSGREGGSPGTCRYRVLDRYIPVEELISRLMDACAEAWGDENGEGIKKQSFSEETRGNGQNEGSGGRFLYGKERDPLPGLARENRPIYGLRRREEMPPGCELIGIYSPVGRCGKTGFALAMGEILAEEKRVIYLNLERYSGLKDLGIVPEDTGDINDLVYFCRMDPDSLVYRLGTLIRTFRNLDYIAPAVSGEDTMGIDADEWCEVISALARAGEYETVILDLGVSVTDAVPLLDRCTVIYMPVLDDRVSGAKVCQFFAAAERLGRSGIREKTRRLHLPAVKEELWGKDVSTRLIRGKMGAFVRKLLQNEE